MSPRTDVSEERKNQILDAAMETFSKVGFHKARMSDIAESSGLSKGSLYWYFENKNDLIVNLLARVFEPELKDLRDLLTDPRPVDDRLLAYAERSADDMVKMLKWVPLVYDFIALAFRQETIKESIKKFYQQNMEIVETLIQQGLDSGELVADNAKDAAIAIGSILEGTVVLWTYAPEQIDIKKHVMTNMNILMKGLLPAK
ncbi:MAG: TetR/AcrR family transcriptional regulator [Anaerolineales bacterium]